MDSGKRQLYRLKAQVLKAMAHPLRLAIMDLLADGEVCVCHIADAVEAERSNVSRHLAKMEQAGIITSQKRGLMVFYSLRVPCVMNFFGCVEKVLRSQARQNAKVLQRL